MISLLTINTFTYSGAVVATISNGVSQSIGFFDIRTNTVNTTYSVLTYSQVVNEPLLDRLQIDANSGYEFYVQEFKQPSFSQFRVTYYRWNSMTSAFDLIKNTLILKDYNKFYNRSVGDRPSQHINSNGTRCGCGWDGCLGNCGCSGGYNLTPY